MLNIYKNVKSRFLSGKKLLLILLCAMATSFCLAQEIEWQNTIGGSDYDRIFSMQQTVDGGYILGGYSASDISADKTENHIGGYDYWLVKIDANGVVQWQNTIGGIITDDLYSIKQTTDKGYILGGVSDSYISGDKTENSNGLYDFWMVKTDSTGTIQWQNTIGGNKDDNLYSIQETTDGGFIMGGYSDSDSSGDKTEGSIGMDIWIVKTNSAGVIQWESTIGGNSGDFLKSMQQCTDGGYILGGSSSSNISGDKTENSIGNSDIWIIKIDSLGNIQWQNTIGGTDMDGLNSIQQTKDGGFILGANSMSNISGDKTENSNGSLDYWIIKIDSIGNIQWQNTIGGIDMDGLNSIYQTIDGGYVLGGVSVSNISGDKSENNLGTSDYWIVKTDSLGNILWQNTLGGNNYDDIYYLQETADSGIILCGESESNISNESDKTENCLGGWDFWIVKLTDKYNSIIGKSFLDFNNNLLQDASEPGLTQNKITETITNLFAFSQPNGFYSVSVLDTGNFTVTPTPINYYNTVPVTHTATFTGINQTDSLNDFAFQPAGVFNDLCVTITPLGPFRAGMNASYMINYGNYGTTSLNGDVIFFPFNNVTYVSSNTTPTAVTVDSVVWSTGVLAPFQTGSIVVTVNVNAGLPIGTLINSSVRIEPVANDANPGCNYSHWEVFTTGSIDPNDILVNEDTLTTTQLATAPFLDYIIRFQNTGNDTAFTVKVLNPIDTNKLELSTIEFVNSSHPVNLNWINYQRNMEFKFDNILLPDSGTNEPASHGFVHYRIKPKTTLLAGDSVTNNAYIYFDFNSPVATNTAVTKIVLPTGLAQEAVSSRQLVVYPNPAKDEITIQLNYPNYLNQPIKVFDVYGKQIFSTRTTTSNLKLQTTNYPQGVYFVQVGSLRAKFVKQ